MKSKFSSVLVAGAVLSLAGLLYGCASGTSDEGMACRASSLLVSEPPGGSVSAALKIQPWRADTVSPGLQRVQEP